MLIKNNVTTGLVSKYKAAKSFPTNYVDKFIEVMADSSKAKETDTFYKSLTARATNVDLPKSDNIEDAKAFLVKSANPSKYYCIFLHDGTSTNSNYQDLLLRLSDKNINVLAIEYPGYGVNKGLRASSESLNEISETGYKYLTEELGVKPENINIMGYCLGGQIATNLAAKNECNSALLISPITKFTEISKGYINSKKLEDFFNSKPKKLLIKTNFFKIFLRDKLNSYKNIDNINCPIFVISSGQDPVTDIKFIDKFVKKLQKRDKDVTYIRNYTKGHKLEEEKLDMISVILCSNVFKS